MTQWLLGVFLLAPAAAVTAAPGNASADTADANDIVVIGTREQGYRATVAPVVTKSDTSLKEVPFSVQVVTRELIVDRGITTVGEALRYVPGLSPQVGFASSNDRLTVRGFTVPYSLKNGFRRSAFGTDDQLANIEQFEILKGPASALYGRSEPGGVVNITTKKPLDGYAASFTAQYGSFDALRLTADLNAPVSEAVAFRLNASFDDRESYRDLGFSRDWFVAPVARFQLSDDTRLVVEGEYSDRHSFADRGFGNHTIFMTAPRNRQFGNRDARLNREAGLVSTFLDHRFNDALSARLAFGYSESTVSGLFYAYGFPAVLGAGTANPRVNVRPTRSWDQQRNLTTQAEVYARFDTGPVAHKAMAGFEYGYDRWSYAYFAGSATIIRFQDPVYPSPVASGPFIQTLDSLSRTKASALYAQDELSLGQFRLLLGGRVDWSSMNFLERIEHGDAVYERKETAFSPRAGLTWTPLPEVSLYASWSRSFVPQQGILASGRPPEAVEAEAFEVGLKSSFLDGRITPTVSFFTIDRFNAAVADPDDAAHLIQIGKSRTQGIEIDIPAAVTPRWRLIGGFAHLDAEVRRDTFLPTGTRLINAPGTSASLWTSYDFPGALDGLSLGLGAQRVGKRNGNANGTVRLPAYTRTDANLSYTFGGSGGPLKAQLNVLNLFDKLYFDSGGGFLPAYPGAPRTVSVSLAYSFGGARR